MNKKFKIFLVSMITLCGVCFLAAAAINIYIIEYSKPYIISEEEASGMNKDCVIALGAQVYADGTPCDQLYDRVSIASKIHIAGAGKKLLLSGDARDPVNYNEISAMIAVAFENGAGSDTVVTDPYGLNTFQSMHRMKNEYRFDSAVVATQEYHIYRSVFLARKLGIDAYGVCSDPRSYASIAFNEAREFLARIKAFYLTINL